MTPAAPRVQRARRLAVMAAVIAVAGVPLALGGCGSGGRTSSQVTLLPDLAARGHDWHWTVKCPFEPAKTGGCEAAGPVLGTAQLTGDGWNLGGTGNAGVLDMSVGSRGDVTINGAFASTPPCTASSCLAPAALTWVRGFPSVLYGIDQCHARTSPPQSQLLPLPMRLALITPHLIGVTTYSADTTQITYDVAYDLWLHDTGTNQPCRSAGTLEIMVWTDYSQRALLPASMQVGTANVPFAVGRITHLGTGAWSVYASNIYQAGRTAPWGGTLWFVLNQADTVRHGQVSVDLSAVLSAASQLLRGSYNWPALGPRYWLDTASFGVEFGPASGSPTDSGPSRFSLRISRYCLAVRSTLAAATCA